MEIAKEVLEVLLLDRTTGHNIIWATDSYAHLGEGFSFNSEILPEHLPLIQTRSSKSSSLQDSRTRSMAEVFTPVWVCNKQNNLVDESWFGRKDVFNAEFENGWNTRKEPIIFPRVVRHSWKNYVDTKRLEISCGEAPYLVSRYDAVTGVSIPVPDRVGLLDRKLRIVSENAESREIWLQWAERAFQSVYGFEYQGDSLILARENLLLTFIEYYEEQYHEEPSVKQLLRIARFVSWNLWQMDGEKGVVPDSCRNVQYEEITLFGANIISEPCPGCVSGNIRTHNGIYCKIHDWRDKSSLTYISMMGK